MPVSKIKKDATRSDYILKNQADEQRIMFNLRNYIFIGYVKWFLKYYSWHDRQISVAYW